MPLPNAARSLAVVAICASCASTIELSPIEFDASGVDAFWAIHDRLAADESIDEATWHALFEEPGYREMNAVENRERWMLQILELAYRPSLDSDARETLAGGGFIAQIILPHLRLAAEKRAELDVFVAESPVEAWCQDGVRVAARYLPVERLELDSIPPVYFALLSPDGKAFEDSIVVDPLLCMYFEEPELFFAHELHHVLRRQIDGLDADAAPEHLRGLFGILENLETEGIADLIDKRAPALDPNGPPSSEREHPAIDFLWTLYLQMLDEFPGLVRSLDDVLVEIARDPSRAPALADELRPSLMRITGRPIGMTMANAIEREFGTERVRSVVGDPFGFLIAYSETGEEPRFSDSSVELLRRWQSEYIAAPGG